MQIINLVKLFFLNALNYGLFPSIIILYFEVLGLLKFKNINELRIVEDINTSYLASKSQQKYNTAYIPTPYYFLFLIKKYLIRKKIKKFNFIDLGCGYSRPANYLNYYFNINYVGIDINKEIINSLNSNKNFKYYSLDLRDKKNFFKIINDNFKNKKIIFFLSDPFDISLVNDILVSAYKKKLVHKIIMINAKYNMIKKKYFILDLAKKFNKRSVAILKPKIQ